VYRNGVKLGDADYTATSGTSIVLGEGAAVSDIIEIVTYDVFSVADTVSKADGGTFDGNVTMAGTLAVTGETTLSTHLNMGDNDIIKLGDSADLQIYHDPSAPGGATNFIKENGGIYTFIQGNTLRLRNRDGSKNYINMVSGAGVDIYYDNAPKLATTSTGIDVTGTAVTDGLTVAGNLSVDGGTIKLDGNYPVGTDNVALGNTAGDSIVSGGNFNTLIGANAGTAISTGDNNVAVGYNSLSSLTTGETNVAVGMSSLAVNTANNNVGVGYQALFDNTTGSQNTSMGRGALSNNTTASNNVSIGYASMNSNTTGASNTVLGTQALQANTTASNNTAVGYRSLYTNTTGIQNVAMGKDALFTNTGSYNVGIGENSLGTNSSGSSNVAVGRRALFSNTTAYNNTAVGYQAGYSNTTGGSNTAIGMLSLYTNSTGTENNAIGVTSLYANTTGNNNTSLGHVSLRFNTTGSNNTGLGHKALYNNTTGNSNTAIGYNTASTLTTGSQNTCLGFEANVASAGANNSITLGNADVTALRCQQTSISSLSDARDKTDIIDLPYGLEFINKTRPVQFKWNLRDAKKESTLNGTIRNGFIAQELQDLGNNDQHQLVYDENPEKLEARYGNLMPMLVKAIQELSAKNDALEARIATLEGA